MIRATTGPKKPVSRLTKTERWERTDQVLSSLGLMAVVVGIPGPDPPPGPLGSGSTPSFLRSSDKARLPISPYLCTDKYVRLIRMFHGQSIILPTSQRQVRVVVGPPAASLPALDAALTRVAATKRRVQAASSPLPFPLGRCSTRLGLIRRATGPRR